MPYSSNYQLFWGDTHNNTYQFGPQEPGLDTIFEYARQYLDFYAAAYYTACAEGFQKGGHNFQSTADKLPIIVEGWKPDALLEKEWAEVQEATRRNNAPGTFVTFPGYEWQGDGSPGDHNVFYREEGLSVFKVDTIEDLYRNLRGQAALAIPHHTAYRPGRRAPDWAKCDESLSPFVEVYSVHGCSETDEEWIGLRHNAHMGPGAGGATYQDALDRGLHLGAICSTDNWDNMPGHYNEGLMGCYAEELTRESLWEAFLARRVYGVTGDRIRLEFSVDGVPMGGCLRAAGPRQIRVRVVGCDEVDRIEVLRNGKLLATHCHQGTWDFPASTETSRYKLRLEAGWGPRPNELDLPPHSLNGEIAVTGGKFLGHSPCWVCPQPAAPALNGETASFQMTTTCREVVKGVFNANVFEFEAGIDSMVHITMNRQSVRATVGELGGASRILWYREESVQRLKEYFDLSPEDCEREDQHYHLSHKVKIHRLIPEAGYTAEFELEDDEPLDGEVNYRVRVEQRNGQRAWSSPVWVQA